MINFWSYDQSGGADNSEVRTDFFDIAANPDGETFSSFNASKTMPLCGQMAAMQANLDFNEDTKGMAVAPLRIPEQITIKHI